MEKVSQLTREPTRKAASATIGAALMAITGLVIRHYAPDFYDPDVWLAVQPAVVLGFAYAFKEEMQD